MRNYNEINVGDNIIWHDAYTDKKHNVKVVEKKRNDTYYFIKVKLTDDGDTIKHWYMLNGCVGALCASYTPKFNELY